MNHARLRPSARGRRFVTIAGAAEYLGVDPKTIRRRIADGTFPAYHIGPRLLRVDLNEVDAAMRIIPTAGNGAA